MWLAAPPGYPFAYRNRSRERLRFQSVGSAWERYPDWVRALDGYSGVYVIRDLTARGPRIAYVGESHRDRLYGTFTRHFQVWARGQGKGYSAHDPGLTYDRDRSDAAAIITSRDRAYDTQNAFIAWLRPRDNVVGAVANNDDHDDDDNDAFAVPSFVADDEPIPF